MIQTSARERKRSLQSQDRTHFFFNTPTFQYCFHRTMNHEFIYCYSTVLFYRSWLINFQKYQALRHAFYTHSFNHQELRNMHNVVWWINRNNCRFLLRKYGINYYFNNHRVKNNENWPPSTHELFRTFRPCAKK